MNEVPRHGAGTPAGGQFMPTARTETSTSLDEDAYWAAFDRRHPMPGCCSPTTLHADPTVNSDAPAADPTRFGPQGAHAQALLDRIAALTPEQAAAMSAHAPMVTYDGASSELFCPNADATRYTGLGRYRRMTRQGGPMEAEVQVALAEVGAAAGHLCEPVVEALKDAVVAQVLFGKIHAIAYDTLTRAVRQALGPVRGGDGPLHH